MKLIKDNKSIKVKMCNNFFNRFMGFMFKRKIDYCLCFPKCNSIHTFFMLKNIDVIMTDKNYKILYAYKNFKPYKIIFPKKNVYYTFELPSNIFKFEINETIKVK
ncbi:MAG: DUF192 domain-containing protein [Bacilli bacterium]|nr:DUF192 domain-containing protein [Bacilli bacterium]